MSTKNLIFENFINKKVNSKLKKFLKDLISSKSEVINSLSKNYKNSFTNKILKKYKKYQNFRLIGMGGSTLGTQTIYSFLNHKIKKNFLFIDNLNPKNDKNSKKKIIN